MCKGKPFHLADFPDATSPELSMCAGPWESFIFAVGHYAKEGWNH